MFSCGKNVVVPFNKINIVTCFAANLQHIKHKEYDFPEEKNKT